MTLMTTAFGQMLRRRPMKVGTSRIGELASFGVGPHEVVLMPDGATLVVANGGIRTHPDRDRAKLKDVARFRRDRAA